MPVIPMHIQSASKILERLPIIMSLSSFLWLEPASILLKLTSDEHARQISVPSWLMRVPGRDMHRRGLPKFQLPCDLHGELARSQAI